MSSAADRSLKRMEIIEPARVVVLPERPYLGIRVITPFRGMIGVSDELFKELRAWKTEAGVETLGHGFVRLHVIDMSGPMDIEVGFLTPGPAQGDGRVQSGVLPEGRYATLTYVNHAIRANRRLIEWARDEGIQFDRRDVPEGDSFACRYEALVSDPTLEPRKTKQQIELAFKIV